MNEEDVVYIGTRQRDSNPTSNIIIKRHLQGSMLSSTIDQCLFKMSVLNRIESIKVVNKLIGNNQ